jgi:phosphoribosylanthranilate isomerase
VVAADAGRLAAAGRGWLSREHGRHCLISVRITPLQISKPALSKLWIKICGITRCEDADAAVALGANALGAVLYAPSSRAVKPAQLADIFATVPASVTRVGLFVNPAREEVEAALETGRIDCLQFHGDEDDEFCASFVTPYMKAIRVGADRDAAAELNRYPRAEYLLLDSYDKKVAGGTGKTFDWNLARKLVGASKHDVVLAGGLNVENVKQAVEQVRPFGLDVSSGVESAPGIKNADKLRQFIEGARNGGSSD